MDPRLKSKEWRIRHLYKIRNKQARTVVFRPNRAQTHFMQNLHTRNVILKSRRLGFSTYEVIDGLDDVLWNHNFDMLLVAHKLKGAADKIFNDMVKFAWDNYPKELKGLYTITKDTGNELKFDFGGDTMSSFSVDTSGRSGGYQRLHVSEYGKISLAYPGKSEEILSGSIPTVPSHGRVDIESTAEGDEGNFYDLYHIASDNPQSNMEFKRHFYNWTWDVDDIANTVKKPLKVLPGDFRDLQKLHNLTDTEITYYFYKWQSLGEKWELLRREYPTTDEEAFTSKIIGSYYADILDQLTEHGHISDDVTYNPKYLVDTFWDIGLDGTAVWFVQMISGKSMFVDFYYVEGRFFEDVADDIIKLIDERGYVINQHYPPHDLFRREYFSSKQSRWQIARDKGILFREDAVPILSKEDQIDASASLLKQSYFNATKCAEGIRLMRRYRRNWNENTKQWNKEPVHDASSHVADAYSQFATIHRDKVVTIIGAAQDSTESKMKALLNNS